MRKATKIVISFAVVLIAGLNLIVPALAQDPFTSVAIGGLGGLSGAGLFSSMASASGINIGWGNTGSDPVDAMWNVLNPDHVYFSGEKHEADPQTDPEDVWDYITVDIGDWLSAQSDFIVNFAQTYNVTDNSTGSTTMLESMYGYPFSQVGSYKRTPIVLSGVGSLDFGGFNVTVSVKDATHYYIDLVWPDSRTYRTTFTLNEFADGLAFYQNGNTVMCGSFLGNTFKFAVANTDYNYNPDTETLPWTSGTVNTSVFDGWEDAKVKIPHNISGLSTGWTIPDFLDAINDIWERNQQGLITIEDTDSPVPPPPVPVPTTPLGQVPFDDWVDLWGQGIYQQLENQSDALDFIGSNGTDAIEELESIDSNIGELEEVAESIDTNIGIGNGLLGGIRSLAQSAVNYLEGIAEHVGELVEEIVEGTETLIAGILNQIPQAFSVIFGPIKQASSIWHYVVEWIQSIGAPFQFIWSMASGTSYYIILPVYASLAAAVVLAFFKRFGR